MAIPSFRDSRTELLRETSIAFAVLFGGVVLRERTGIVKTVAVAGMLAGVVILRVA